MTYSDNIYKNHRFCPGTEQDPCFKEIPSKLKKSLSEIEKQPADTTKRMDQAWLLCLLKAGLVEHETVKRLFVELAKEIPDTFNDGEKRLTWDLKIEEDTASIINYGRTLQEPMSRLQLRKMCIRTMDNIVNLMETVLQTIEKNVDTIMPGHTHLSQAQPITLAHYLLSIYDAIGRSFKQLELAYSDTNRNTGGCGATSGTAWPVDRNYLTELLGFDETVEPTYDCEASQDHSMSIIYSLCNLATIISKSSMDLNIWGMEEVGMLKASYDWCGVSSLMPQKCIPGSQVERSRFEACFVFGEMMTGLTLSKGEPHADMLPICQVWGAALRAMLHAEASMSYYGGILQNSLPQKERMLQNAREGYSCATEVVVHMVKELGYGGRRGHRILGTFVRMAREKGLKAYETTGELLDEAARFAGEKEPGIDTDTLRKLLDPVEFIKSHNNIGGTSEDEAKRMINVRLGKLEDIKKRHGERKNKIKNAMENLKSQVEEIINN
jgi:argininosuccinate lyase